MSSLNHTSSNGRPTPHISLGWALKRALLGIMILVVMFGGGAWLLYATIEPDRADASETSIASPAQADTAAGR